PAPRGPAVRDLGLPRGAEPAVDVLTRPGPVPRPARLPARSRAGQPVAWSSTVGSAGAGARGPRRLATIGSTTTDSTPAPTSAAPTRDDIAPCETAISVSATSSGSAVAA